MTEYHTVCKLADLKPNEGKTVAIGHRMVALFLIDGVVHAIDDTCPHMGASLSGGYFENNIVTCPWHAWRFRVTDGVWADNPRIKIGCHSVRVVGDDVQVQIASPIAEKTP
ncbi:MAG: Rieske (2Fe-2S) protein [Planctomycetes bacterium]|nr:Rieske (2Fe-2S) protein [Planctomycetota bacterium]